MNEDEVRAIVREEIERAITETIAATIRRTKHFELPFPPDPIEP